MKVMNMNMNMNMMRMRNSARAPAVPRQQVRRLRQQARMRPRETKVVLADGAHRHHRHRHQHHRRPFPTDAEGGQTAWTLEATGFALRASSGASASAPEVDREDEVLEEGERARRKKISEKLKGRSSWNKGRRWSPAMVAKIRKASAIAMERPEVKEKLARHSETIAAAARAREAERRRVSAAREAQRAARARAMRDAMYKKKLKQCVSRFNAREEALRRRGAHAPCSPALAGIGSATRHTPLARATCTRALARKVIGVLPSTLSRGGDRGGASALSPSHRRRISEAIARKWKEKGYRKKVTYGIRRRLRSNAAIKGEVDVLKELRARAEMINNARRLLRRAEEAAFALERKPNVSDKVKKEAREKVQAIMRELRVIRKDIVNARERESVDVAILEEMKKERRAAVTAEEEEEEEGGN